MLDAIKKLLRKLIVLLYELTTTWGNDGEKPPPPPPPLELPFYIEDMRKTHPGRSDEELAKVVTLTAQEDTHFFIHRVDAAGSIIRNEAGNMMLRKMAGQGIDAGTEVLVYRWAFPVDGGNVRESRWHITDQKGMIDIKKFSKPE